MEEERKSWALIIKSCLLSSKQPLTPDEINRDTKLLDGKNIPYQQLEYNSLVEMLKDINGLKVFKSNGKTLVKVIASEKTAHIQKMVKLQKKSKKAKKRPITSPTPRYNTRQTKVQEPRINTKLDRLQHRLRNNNASSLHHFEQATTPSPNTISQPQQCQQQQFPPDRQPVLVFQPIIQVVPYLTIDPQLMGLYIQFLQHLSAPNFQFMSQPSYSSNRM